MAKALVELNLNKMSPALILLGARIIKPFSSNASVMPSLECAKATSRSLIRSC
jgi:hypothetical protein